MKIGGAALHRAHSAAACPFFHHTSIDIQYIPMMIDKHTALSILYDVQQRISLQATTKKRPEPQTQQEAHVPRLMSESEREGG